jgi:hypothetical protein
MPALSRAHVLVLVDTVAEEFDAAICYGAAQEQEAVLVPNTDPHRRFLDPKGDVPNAPSAPRNLSSIHLPQLAGTARHCSCHQYTLPDPI